MHILIDLQFDKRGGFFSRSAFANQESQDEADALPCRGKPQIARGMLVEALRAELRWVLDLAQTRGVEVDLSEFEDAVLEFCKITIPKLIEEIRASHTA